MNERYINIIGYSEEDDVEIDLNLLKISKASMVKSTDKEFIYLEKMKDNTWRLTWTEKTIPDMSKVTSFRMIRNG